MLLTNLKEKKMAKIIETQMQVFVTYKINPVPEAFEDSLYKHLLSE